MLYEMLCLHFQIKVNAVAEEDLLHLGLLVSEIYMPIVMYSLFPNRIKY